MSVRAHLNEPIHIPRWVLVLKYAFFVLLAGITAVKGSATLDLTTPASYTPIWSAAVAVGAVVALVACLFKSPAPAEKWAAAWVAGWLSVVAVNSIFVSTGSGYLYVILVALLPAGRAVGLFSKRAK